LLIGLIMLVLMTLTAIATFNLGKSNFQVVGNTQARNESMASAESAIEEVMSNPKFVTDPANLLPSGGTTKSFDVNADGKNDVTVTLTSNCIKAKVIPVDELVVANPDDAVCLAGVQQQFGVAGAGTGDSMCGDTLWDIQATAVDQATQARVVVAEGAQVRVSKDTLETNCP
jgi:Tfp pilus assembly protein PilX